MVIPLAARKRSDRTALTSILAIEFDDRKLQGVDDRNIVGRAAAS